MAGTVELRLYGPLNDFVAPERRGRTLTYALFGTPSVKDVLEAVGPPHPEIALVLVDGEPSGFERRLRGGERVAAYPPFDGLAERPRFLLDGHLATLAVSLRLFGFDAELPPNAADAELARRSHDEDRVLLTRDLGLLKRSEVVRGAFVRAREPRAQELEIVRRFDLLPKLAPFTRCSVCNAALASAAPAQVDARVPDGVRARVDHFMACPRCGRVYWQGSHADRIRARIAAIRLELERPAQKTGQEASSPTGADQVADE